MDFIFGTLATDDLKVVHHRANRRGIQHGYRLTPLDPRPGEAVTITVQLGPDLPADHVALYYTLDGTDPVGQHGVAQHGSVLLMSPVAAHWDSLVWGYLASWQTVIPAQPAGTVVRYQIGAWFGDEPETFADWPNVTATAEAAAGAFFHGKPFSSDFAPGSPARGHTFTYHVDDLTPPTWARDAVIYHVFVDRFYPGDGKKWLQTDDLMEICGGTLWGVRDKLDYIADLGATCIWLSPTWVSPSHHGYDVTDYDHVEERLGGDQALHTLVDAAHTRGIRILLDLVCNHICDSHPIFQSALTEGEYRNWFSFDDSLNGYQSFFGNPGMPQLNLAYGPARDWMIGIACRWLRDFDVDGYRLDYANGPGPDFWSDFRAACKAEKPDCFLFGEVVDAPDMIKTYVGRLDGCLDFHLGAALRQTYGWQEWPVSRLQTFINRHYTYFPSDFLLPTFLDNHDMDRFLFIAGGDKQQLRRAAAVQMSLPGIPIIFYGTEVGLSQQVSTGGGMGLHVSRTPMLWGDDQDHGLLAYYQSLIQKRKQHQLAAFPVAFTTEI